MGSNQVHVTDVRIFKSHDDHHEFSRGKFLFQVTEYWKTNCDVIPHRKSMFEPVPFEISPSQLSSQDGLFNSVHCSVSDKLDLDSMFFIDSKRLAEKITAKIMSRFSFITTTSCSNLIIAVNVDILCKTDDDDDDDDHNDDDQDNNDDNEDNDENNNSQITTEFPHQNLSSIMMPFQVLLTMTMRLWSLWVRMTMRLWSLWKDMVLMVMDDDEVVLMVMDDDEVMALMNMDDDDDGEDDDDDGEDDDDNDEYDNSFSGFEEDFFTNNIKGFSEVTGLVDVKPDEVLNSTDCCSICLEEYGSDFSRVAMAETSICSHLFHKDCIGPWLRTSSNSCPLCRSVFIARI